MGNGYGPVASEENAYAAIFAEIYRRLRELEALDGSQIYNTVQDLKNLIDGLVNQVNGNFTGTLTVGGSSTLNSTLAVAGSATLSSTLTVPAAYGNNLTGVGGYRTAYWGINGEAGYVPSSIQFKRDIEPAKVDADAVLAVEPVSYRYKDAVDNFGENAPVEFGVIAEQVEALGLHWLVDYEVDAEGNKRPLGFKYDRLPVALLVAMRSLHERLRAVES